MVQINLARFHLHPVHRPATRSDHRIHLQWTGRGPEHVPTMDNTETG